MRDHEGSGQQCRMRGKLLLLKEASIFIKGVMVAKCMTLREIEPLDDAEWKELTDDVEAGQTAEQAQALKEALKSAKDIPTVTF